MTDTLDGVLRALAQPARARLLRRVLAVLLALWAVYALAQLIWALFPGQDTPLPEDAVVINPVSRPAPAAAAETVDIERMKAWHLFGEVGAEPAPEVEPETVAAVTGREGIEKGARETRLDLKLRGVVASTVEGLGHAIIEHKNKQAVYAVDDKLPVPGQVALAKVMQGQVVLDNGGTYELLELFGDSPLDTQLAAQPAPSRVRPVGARGPAGARAAALAVDYRQRLYQNPQSLAEVVTISAVRENGELRGYRINPGKEPEQFAQLGFKPGDLVTSVNGIELDDPANTVRLYQTMRSASEAVFDLQRDEQQLTVSVRLDAASGE
jgi:general secretion pathway protein C